jgi:hypothetical protein
MTMAESTGKHEDGPQLAAGESTGDGATEHAAMGALRDGGMGDEDSPYRTDTESPSHTLSPTPPNRCQSTNRRGEPCRAPATQGRYCIAHSGKVDMAAIGRKGGLSTETEVRKQLRSDEEIREAAQDVIRRGLRGDAKVTKTMLDAARSVFSFRAAQPPSEPQGHERERMLTAHGRPIATLEDVLLFGIENEGSRALVAPIVDRLAARLAELRAGTATAAAGRDPFETVNEGSI